MRKRVLPAIAALLGALCVCAGPGAAQAETRQYIFGGSGEDSVQAIAASADGRIVLAGHTSSTDGTLASRTKSGQSGWALCVDMQGEVLWSFCSRLGTQDRMDAPVFHEDGSVTLVLCAGMGGWGAYELIRLDRNGEVVSRRTLMEGGGISSLYRPQVTGAGYILREYGDDLLPRRIALFGFDGNLVREMEEWLPGAPYTSIRPAQRHVLHIGLSRARLTALDDQGNETLLAEPQDVIPNPGAYAIYLGMLSLPDGGVAAAGRMAAEEPSGRLTRWDAQGNIAFDWWVQAGDLFDLTGTRHGFAALMQPYEQPKSPEEFTWSLAFFGEDGIQTGSVSLPETETHNGVIAALPDGGVAVAQETYGMTKEPDIVLTIVPGEDVP